MSVAWVLGKGGLLGRAVSSRVGEYMTTWAPTEPISWIDEGRYQSTIDSAIGEFEQVVRNNHGNWTLFWCAGVGTIGATEVEIDGELSRLSYLLDELGRRIESLIHHGTFFYSSSAGALYGGSQEHLITEESEVSVNSAYGSMKLRAEKLLEAWASETGCRVALGRISNIYGPGQNIRKQQGLVSAACVSVLKQQPLDVFVPLDTTRNYIYVSDAAAIAVSFAEKVSTLTRSSVERKIICSPQNLSVAALLLGIRQVYGRRPPVALTSKLSSGLYNRNLSMASIRHCDVEPRQFVSPVLGIAEVRRSLLLDLMDGVLV